MSATELRELPAVRIFVLMLSLFIGLLIVAFVGQALEMTTGLNRQVSLFILSAFQCVVAFCIPAWITARFSSPSPDKFLYLNAVPSVWAFIGVIMIILIALPAFNEIVEWNQNIHLPEKMGEIETTMREWEQNGEEVINNMLNNAGIPTIITGILIIGVLTGFSEELFFRGALQGVFMKSSIPTWVAVWGAAAIFSAIHFQFFGFIPRLLMGAFFGYLLVWSKSLWLPIFAHAFNNSVVILSRTLGDGDNFEKNLEWNNIFPDANRILLISVSVLLTIMFLIAYKKYLTVSQQRNKWK